MGIQAPAQVKYGLICKALQSDNNLLSITLLCQIAGVSRSGYYGWLESASFRIERDDADQRDFELVLEAYAFVVNFEFLHCLAELRVEDQQYVPYRYVLLLVAAWVNGNVDTIYSYNDCDNDDLASIISHLNRGLEFAIAYDEKHR